MVEVNGWLVAVAVGVAIVALLALLQWRRPALAGLQDKTAWDWLVLFMAPAVIIAATAVITEVQKQTETRRAQEVAIQSYVDRISALVIQQSATTDPEQVAAIGRAHTAAVLHLATQERAGRILAFLGELGLIADYAPSLEGFDFTRATLKGLALDGLDFEDAILRHADLEEASLNWVDFEFADLRDADLDWAVAHNADFEGALLDGATLNHADLRHADLSLSAGLTAAQLANSCLDATTLLPPGFAPVEGETAACGALRAAVVEAGEGIRPAVEDRD